MNAPVVTCPACGIQTKGRYCNNCGSAVAGVDCPSCSVSLPPGARFCHICGVPISRRSTRRARVPWLIAGVSVVLTVIVAVVRFAGPLQAPPARGATPQSTRSVAPDISNMSPRERADRLFNRIVAAAERNDFNEVAFFTPMASQAYQLLGQLDSDARYHLGLIYALSSRPAAALAHADTLKQGQPGHLLATVIQNEVAKVTGDEPGRVATYQTFLSNYASEIASGKREYSEHRRTLDLFLEEARAALEGSPGR